MKTVNSINRLFAAALVFAILACSSSLLSTALAQGEITPPGPPGPLYKTLQQVEPRTAITNTGAVTISAAGSYYLTANIAVTAGSAITITADNITLDLKGFTVSSTEASPTGTGILISGNRRNITIKDGFIGSGVTRSGGVFSGSGFAHGIYIASGQPLNVLISRVSVAGVLVEGIDLGTGESTFVESCNARMVGGNGIVAGVVRDCLVRECGLDGVIGISVENCSALAIGSGTGVKATSVLNCHGTSFAGGKGVDAYSASNCRGIAFGAGTGINAVVATGCTGSSEIGAGVNAETAENCYGQSTGGVGVRAETANNCRGISVSYYGIFASGAANNCRGTSTSDVGVYVSNANNCRGESSSSTGLLAFTANNCFGLSDSGYGLISDVATGCIGYSTTSVGVRFWRAGAMCYGSRDNPSASATVLGTGQAGPVNLP